MAYPASLPLRPVSFGAAVILEDGTPLGMRVELVASGSLVWAQTGTPLVSHQRTWDGAEDHERVFSLPVTDSPGYRATNGQIIDVSGGKHSHTYSGRVTYFLGDVEIRRADIGPFALPRGDGSTVDIDTLIPVTTTTGVTITIPDQWAGVTTEAAILIEEMRDLIQQGGGGQQEVLPGMTLTIHATGTTWPPRPTPRTDVTVQYVGSDLAHPPTDARDGDLWMTDVAI